MKRSPLKRKTRLRPVNAQRRKAAWIRAYGGKRRIAFVKSLPCIVQAGDCAGPIDVAHTKVGGMSRKADARFTVPLCRRHHRALHTVGRETFETTYAVNLEAAAALTELQWQWKGFHEVEI